MGTFCRCWTSASTRRLLRVAGSGGCNRSLNLNAEEQLFLTHLIMRPSTIEELAAEATTPELGAEVYAAARLAIDPDAAAERDFLDRLAAALKLDSGLRAHLDAIGGSTQSHAA